MEVFSQYFVTVKPYIQLLLCFNRVCFVAIYIFQRFIKSQHGFSNASAGYTFSHSLLVVAGQVREGRKVGIDLSCYCPSVYHVIVPGNIMLLSKRIFPPAKTTHLPGLFDLKILNFTYGIKRICIIIPNLHILLPPFKNGLYSVMGR